MLRAPVLIPDPEEFRHEQRLLAQQVRGLTGSHRPDGARPAAGATLRRASPPGLLLMLVLLAAGCGGAPDHEVEARWARGELPPEQLIEDSTPARSDDGIDLRELRCSADPGGLHYELELVNPYEATLDAWAFTSLDGPGDGHLWGLYQFGLPPGRVAVTFPDVLDDDERAETVGTALDEVGGELVGCSIVFLGISDHEEAAFVHPVITTDLPGRARR